MRSYKRYEHGSYPFSGQDWDQRQFSGKEGLRSLDKFTQGNRFSHAASFGGRNGGLVYPESPMRQRGEYYGNLSDYGERGRARFPEGDVNREMKGLHSGKGPRSYRRSDERIKEIVCDRLCDDAHVDASDIEINVQDAEVTLTGTVDSRSAKRRAEDIAEDVMGVTNVENRIKVRQKSDAPYQGDPHTQAPHGDLRSKTRETFR